MRRAVSSGRTRSEHPLATYHVLLSATLLLLLLGIAMVLSASTVESYRIFGSAYTIWLRQVMFAVVGLVAMVRGITDAGHLLATHGLSHAGVRPRGARRRARGGSRRQRAA